jgi:hypothetical protein
VAQGVGPEFIQTPVRQKKKKKKKKERKKPKGCYAQPDKIPLDILLLELIT